MGTHIQAGAIYTYAPNDRWDVFGWGVRCQIYNAFFPAWCQKRFWFYRFRLLYRINDFLRIRAFGEYSVNGERNASQGYLTPIYPQSGYGMVLEIKFNDYIELHGGMERSYNPMKRKWETSPVLYPVIKLKR